jgi:excisionase family DNA binding protein
MSNQKRHASDMAQGKTSLTQAQRVALLARIVEMALADSEQPQLQPEADTDRRYDPGLPRIPGLDNSGYIAGSSLDGIISSVNLPPEAQALRQVTMRQAAETLGVHERTIRRLVQVGELSAVGRGRLTRIPLRDIAAYQQRNRR